MTVVCERTMDVGVILDVLLDENILDAISEDNFDIESFNFNVIHDQWLHLSDNSTTIGVVQFKQMFAQCWDAHIHILPEHRERYAKESGSLIWDWCIENLNGSLIYTNVPVFCESVKNYLLNYGFKQAGTLAKAWTKNGSQHDMWILTKRAV